MFLYGCQHNEKELQLKQLWRTSIFESHTETAESIYPVHADDRVLTAKLLDGAAPVFYALDGKQGGIDWQLTDTVCTGKVYYNMKPFVSKQGICLPCGRATTCVDIKTGKTRWVNEQSGQPEQTLEPYTNNSFLQAVNDWDGRQSHIREVSAIDGNARPIYTVRWPDSSKLLIRTPVKVNNKLLLFTAVKMRYGTNETVAKWHLLEHSTGEILSEGEAYPGNRDGYGVTKQPILIGDKAYMVAYDAVFCVSTTTGKELWRKKLPRDMLTSAPVVSKDGLYCPMEDGYIYKFNLADGSLVWKVKTAATPSRLVSAQDFLFIVGGSDGVLYAISAKDGKVVKSLKAPNHYYIKNQFFRRFIGTDTNGEILILFDGNNFRGYKIWR
ncbi:MAG: PQQ-binding-like beta-propeller repeat protein [Saprospiraceae bacterium]